MSLRFVAKLCIIASVAALGAASQAQLRVGAWNITNFGSSNPNDARGAAFKTAIYGVYQGRSFAPDVLLVTELLSATGQNTFLTILNTAPGSPGDWAVSPFISGPDTMGACYYRTSKVQYLGATLVSAGAGDPEPPRDTYRYDVRPIGYPVSGATIALYNVHMKAGTASADEARRLLESQRIRANAQTLPTDWSFMIGGDFNVQGNSDNGYTELVSSKANNLGRFFDPIDSEGHWYNTNSWRFVHTQDPWTGTSSGGMDDRYDFLLTSLNLQDGVGMDYIGNPAIPYSTTTWNDPNHSYRCWGNDGSSFNTGINTTSNAMVGPTIATALNASLGNQSGHLPVFADFRVPPKASVDQATITVGLSRPPLTSAGQIVVTNSANTTLWTQGGVSSLRYQFQSLSPNITVPTGLFTETSAPGGNTHNIQVLTNGIGTTVGTIQMLSNDPVNPVITITVKQDNQRKKW